MKCYSLSNRIKYQNLTIARPSRCFISVFRIVSMRVLVWQETTSKAATLDMWHSDIKLYWEHKYAMNLKSWELHF